MGYPRDVSSGSPRDGQIGSLEDVLGTLEGDVLGTSCGPIFAGWDDSLAIEKRLTLHDVIIHIKSDLNKDKNHYYYKIFLEKSSSQSAKK